MIKLILLALISVSACTGQIVARQINIGSVQFFAPLTLTEIINLWQSQSVLVRVAGNPTSNFAANSTVDGSTTGITYLNGVGNDITNNCIQDGTIKSVTCSIGQIGTSQQIRFKVFRCDGSNYTMISQSEVINVSGATGTRTFSLASPMLAQPGDQLGVWVSGDATPANRVQVNCASSVGASNIIYSAGDITTSDGFVNGIADNELCINGSMNPPFIAITGDSISKGSKYNAFLEGIGPTWATSNWLRQVGYQLRTNTPSLKYQSLGDGGTTFAWAAATGMVYAAASNPRLVFVHSGINDIQQGVNWFNAYNHLGMSNQLNNILQLCNANETLMVDEIFPWSIGTSNQNRIVYQINTNLAQWCALNHAVLLKSHDSMGVSSQAPFIHQLDPAYDLDGIHPNEQGVSNWCNLILSSLNSGALDTHPIIPTANPCKPAFGISTVVSFVHLGDTSANYYVGQTNVSFPTATNLCEVDFNLDKQGTDPIATNTYTLHVFTMSGINLNVGSPVATSVGIAGDDSWNITPISFMFSPPVSLSSSTPYAFVIDQGKVSSTSNVFVGRTTADSIAGSSRYAADSSGVCTSGATTSDMVFTVYAF